MNKFKPLQRLNREQSREQTRARLLAAAHAVFIEKGFALASVEDITAAAGYTRGAFYSNFRDKTQLFIGVLRGESAAIDDDLRQMLAAPVPDAGALREKMAGYYGRLYTNDISSVLWMEAEVVAARDPRFRETLALFLAERHGRLATFVDTYARLAGACPTAPAAHIAIGLMAVGEGMRLAHRCDPLRIDAGTVGAVLAWFINAAIAPPV